MIREEADRSDYPPIADYAPIGDCRTLALVTTSAAIEWWCIPRFDAPSIFAAILDRERGGSWHLEAPHLEPAGRRYLPHSPVLETRVRVRDATVTVIDFLAVVTRDDGPLGPRPASRQKLVRLIRCETG